MKDKCCLNCRHFVPSVNYKFKDTCDFLKEYFPDLRPEVSQDSICAFYLDKRYCKNGIKS